MLRKALILSLIFLPTDLSFAADEEISDRNVVYKTKTEIDFEDLEIEGILQKPQSALILDRKKASFNPLIKLRTDWKEEIDQSTDEIK